MGEKAAFILAAVMLSVVVAGCLAPSYSVYDNGEIKFEYPVKFEVKENNTKYADGDVLLLRAEIPEDDYYSENIEVFKWHNRSLDERLQEFSDNPFLTPLWRGEIQGRPAALDLLVSIGGCPVYHLNIQGQNDVYEITYTITTSNYPTRKITLGNETFEIPENFAHIIETLKFH